MTDDPFSEALIVRYLLGDLPEAQQVEIEDRAFADRQYLQRILAAESDLIDGYVRGELSDAERRLFDSRFLASAERQRKVAFARALAGALSKTAVQETASRTAEARARVSLRDFLAGLLGGLSPVARLGLVAAALLIIVGGAWLVLETLRLRAQVVQLQAEQQTRQRDAQALESQVADERARREDLDARLQSEREQRERSEALIRELERERSESAAQAAGPTLLSLALSPGLPRSSGARPKLLLPPSARLVRLEIGIEPADEYKRFRVELRAQTAQPIWSRDGLPARRVRAGRAIVVNLPAARLAAGQYELALKGITDDGTLEDVGYYYFDVLKK